MLQMRLHLMIIRSIQKPLYLPAVTIIKPNTSTACLVDGYNWCNVESNN